MLSVSSFLLALAGAVPRRMASAPQPAAVAMRRIISRTSSVGWLFPMRAVEARHLVGVGGEFEIGGEGIVGDVAEGRDPIDLVGDALQRLLVVRLANVRVDRSVARLDPRLQLRVMREIVGRALEEIADD